jgi:hypothetical protein
MERKNARKGVSTRSQKQSEGSGSKARGVSQPKRGKGREIVQPPPGWPGDEEVDEDYAEFLKTYRGTPPTSDEKDESQVVQESEQAETKVPEKGKKKKRKTGSK